MSKINIVILRRVPKSRKQVLWNLFQLYEHDFSEIEPRDINSKGEFEYKYFKYYWIETRRRFPFFIYADGNLAGFVMVKRHSMLTCKGEGFTISEFFVLRKYRRNGVGTKAVILAFDRFHGLWEVEQTKKSIVAYKFWRKVIRIYTKGKFKEVYLRNAQWTGPVQMFRN